jgi:hypothetical protein
MDRLVTASDFATPPRIDYRQRRSQLAVAAPPAVTTAATLIQFEPSRRDIG